MTTIPSAWRHAGLGLLLAIAATVVVTVIQHNLFLIWFKNLAAQPDFLGTGLGYLAIGYFLLVPPIDFVLFGAVFAVAIPVSFSMRRDIGYPPRPVAPFRVRRWMISSVALAAVVFALFLGVGGTHLLFPLTAVPAMAAMALGVWYMTRRANDQLAALPGPSDWTSD
jgi:hypothetical protein